METIRQILIRRDGMSGDEADDLIENAQDDFTKQLEETGTVDDDFCGEWFGLEPDYLMEFIDF